MSKFAEIATSKPIKYADKEALKNARPLSDDGMEIVPALVSPASSYASTAASPARLPIPDLYPSASKSSSSPSPSRRFSTPASRASRSVANISMNASAAAFARPRKSVAREAS